MNFIFHLINLIIVCALVCNTDTAITNTFKTINTSLELASKGVNDAIDVSLDKFNLSFSTALSTLELLNGKENVALIDVWPEDFRERDGIPDLRRTARFRYASVSFPEVDANVKGLLKSGKDLDDSLVAAVIRNLKVVQKGSKVIVMDADGSRSKGIARALRKVGIKGPYLVQGGFRSWVQEGLRVKEPKPETTLTILSELINPLATQQEHYPSVCEACTPFPFQ